MVYTLSLYLYYQKEIIIQCTKLLNKKAMNKKEIKNYLNEIKNEAVKQNPTDKPFIRQYLNDTADSVCRYLQYINNMGF